MVAPDAAGGVKGTAGYGGLVTAPQHPRLIATDLDGTLVRTDGSVSERTRSAVLAAQRDGSVFVMVTARPPRWLHDLSYLVGDHGVAIVANGAILYDVPRRKAIRTRLIDPTVALDVAQAIRAELPDVQFAIERSDRYGREPVYLNRWPQPDDTLVASLEVLLSEPAAKLLVRHPSLRSDDLLAQVGSLVGDRVTASHSGGHGLVEISAPGVSKAAMLADFAAEQRISADETVAFGDSINDLPMLAWAGTSYGVANAHPDVLAVVDRICPTNDEDGVAAVLEELFNL
jgi:hydroxymethylpyrimidine pyrophosphatase-like HAD family hydrolase